MRAYEPKTLVAVSRYQKYFPTLPADVQSDIYARMSELIEEEKQYCDKGNYSHMAQILTSIAMYEALQKHGKSEAEAYKIASEEMWKFLDPSGMQKLAWKRFFLPLMKRIVPFGFKHGSGAGWRYTWHKDDPKDEFHFECKPNGVIVQLGCGLETTFYRDNNGHNQWYGVDLPHVIEYRRRLLPEQTRERYIAGDAFKKDWLDEIRRESPDAPLLITASGLFYYFEEAQVLSLIRMLQGHGDIELLFDTVNKSGMAMMQKKHMKTVGHADAKMFFYVDSAAELTKKIGGKAEALAEEPFYKLIPRTGLQISTKVSMTVSDCLKMVKMIQLKLS